MWTSNLSKVSDSQCCKHPEPRPHLVFSEFVDDGFMEEELNVFDKVKRSGCRGTLVNFLLMLGFMRINTFQDAQPPGR